MNKRGKDMKVSPVVYVAALFVLARTGCALEQNGNNDGGQVVSGILQGIGQGLSGLCVNNIVKLR